MLGLDRSDTPSEIKAGNLMPTKFLDEVYAKGLLTAAENQPKEAAIATAAIATVCATIYFSHGQSALRALKEMPELETGASLIPPLESGAQTALLNITGDKLAPQMFSMAKLRSSASALQEFPTTTLGQSPKHFEQTAAESLIRSNSEQASSLAHLGTDSGGMTNFNASNYRWIPARELALNIRTQEGVIMREVEDPSSIVFADDHSIQHILINKSSTDAERADLLMTACYAGLIRNDVLAYDAASKVPGLAIGFHAQPLERFATVEELHKNAFQGAEAYVSGAASGRTNKFTQYLNERFGPMTPEDQEWGRHILTDTSVPESVWKATFTPNTDAQLFKGLDVKTASVAPKSSDAIMQLPAWMRGVSIRGSSARANFSEVAKD